MSQSTYTKKQIVEKLMNDSATKNDWRKSRKSFDDDEGDFAEYCENIYEISSDTDIQEFMDS